MATFEDLTPLQYFGDDWAEGLVAVGWLDQGEEYTCGNVSAEFMAALVSHLRSPWQPMVSGGVHRCDLCRFNEAHPTFRYAGVSVPMGIANVFIPGEGVIYCASSLFAHYVVAHGYRPPEVFMQAVMTCPPAGSMEYRRRLLSNGGRRFLPSANRL